MTDTTPLKSTDPLHGVTLEKLLTELVADLGWEKLAKAVHIRCFYSNPSIASSLKFLRRTPWARKKVEQLYLYNRWVKNMRGNES
jgi:uncharacterized protein (DUF2132 family)